ncbi:uncharacterized protein LOC116342272 [Contarinia nasturtii]|uniref:uncharacterized protein LOC116342272 n=1 Tax=Contarinia nasturtii TaxID=265458 RepID=UPI0012D436CC|nr:uncharacterized protein LOC116342272 [Contarinia nasturtii]
MTDWQEELDKYLSIVERHTTDSLLRIQNAFKHTNRTLEEKATFRNHFLNSTRNRVSEACDRYELTRNVQHRPRSPNNRSTSIGHDRDQSFTSDQRSCSSLSSNNDQFELEQQNKLAHDITICGVPLSTKHEKLRKMFAQLCKKVGVNIQSDEITKIFRSNPKTVIVVQFRSERNKEFFMKMCRKKSLWTNDMMHDEEPRRIYIDYQMTTFYRNMCKIARHARQQNLIHSHDISKQGLMIKLTPRSSELTFLSPKQLHGYLNKLRQAKRRRQAMSSDTE